MLQLKLPMIFLCLIVRGSYLFGSFMFCMHVQTEIISKLWGWISWCREGIATIRCIISQKSADLREMTTCIVYLEVLQET